MSKMYEVLKPEISLSQGDILDDCPIFQPRISGEGDAITVQAEQFWVRAIVLTQACDIEQQKDERILIGTVYPAALLIERGIVKASTVRDQMRRGLMFGWYFLPTAPEGILPESLIDLHDLHTVPRAILDRLISNGKRVCRVVTPYREHIAQHFGVTFMRIALPEPYPTES